MRCCPEPRRVGAVDCCLRRLSLCRMQPPEARFGSSVRPGLALSGQAGSGSMAAAWAQKAFARPILLPRQGEPVGSGFRAPETPSKATGPRQPWPPIPGSPYGDGGAGAENGLRCFLDPRRVGAVVCCPGEFPFAECSCQKIVWGRRYDGASALIGPAGSGGMAGAWAQKASLAQSCFPTKNNTWGVGFGHRRPPAKQQGPGSRGRPVPVRPMEMGVPGLKTACVAFSI